MAAPRKQPGSSIAKIAIAFIGAAFFLTASIVVTWNAHHAQSTGEPMSNGSGGSVDPLVAYRIACVLLLVSLVYGWRGWVLTHPKED
jgi:hypothetical protein